MHMPGTLIDSTGSGLWDYALPASEDIHRVTDAPGIGDDLREALRQAMSSATSCIHDAVQHSGTGIAFAYLAGAKRMVQAVLEDLCQAYAAGHLGEDDFTGAYGKCASLCNRLHGLLFVRPSAADEIEDCVSA
jgi:hypothetical protein